jgi:hypothetical protein
MLMSMAVHGINGHVTKLLYGHSGALLIYAHEHGCPWDIFTCMEAAANGEFLEALK